MKLRNDYNALVIAGGWNINIFNPKWVSKFLLTEEKLEFELPFVAGFPQVSSYRISSKKIRILAQNNRLNFIPRCVDDETFDTIQELAIKIADYLPHTPVTSFGINFVFDDTISDSLLELLLLKDTKIITNLGASLKSTQYNQCFEFKEKIVNLRIALVNSNVEFDFNFHFTISNLAEFKEKITSNQILNLKGIAIDLMQEVYNPDLSGQGELNNGDQS